MLLTSMNEENCRWYIIIQKIAPQAESGKFFQIWFFPDLGEKMAAFRACTCKLSWTLFLPAQVQPLLGAGRKEISQRLLLVTNSCNEIKLSVMEFAPQCKPNFVQFRSLLIKSKNPKYDTMGQAPANPCGTGQRDSGFILVSLQRFVTNIKSKSVGFPTTKGCDLSVSKTHFGSVTSCTDAKTVRFIMPRIKTTKDQATS